MIVDSNSPAPLKYTDPTYQSSLFIRALIIDTSGGSPVLEASVNLAQYLASAVYFGKYTFTAGKTYLLIKNAYTDGTYATVDQNYPQDTDEVQCMDMKTANLDAPISAVPLQVWNEDLTSHTTANTAGKVLKDLSSSGGSGAGQVVQSLTADIETLPTLEQAIETTEDVSGEITDPELI